MLRSLGTMEAAGGDTGEEQAYNPYIVSGEDEDFDRDPEATLRDQDRFLPIANVARIMKKSVPRNGKIAKDAKECVQECVSEFISFITSEASERCHQEKRKTINGEDILFAMSTLGFDNYVEPLKLHLQRYRDVTKGERGASSSQESLEPGLIDQITGNSAQLIMTPPAIPNANIIATDPATGANVIYSASFANQITHFS